MVRTSRRLYIGSRYARDLEAVQHGRIGERITNRLIAKLLGTLGLWRILRRVWR